MEIPDTKRLHKGIPRIIRSLASVKRISFTALLCWYTFYPSHSVWTKGRSFIHTNEFMKISLHAKGCIRSAVESKGSGGNVSGWDDAARKIVSFYKSKEQYEAILVLASAPVRCSRASRRHKNPWKPGYFSAARANRAQVAQYSRVTSLSISPVISFLVDVNWYSETTCEHKISLACGNVNRRFLSYAESYSYQTFKSWEIHVSTLCNKNMLYKVQNDFYAAHKPCIFS